MSKDITAQSSRPVNGKNGASQAPESGRPFSPLLLRRVGNFTIPPLNLDLEGELEKIRDGEGIVHGPLSHLEKEELKQLACYSLPRWVTDDLRRVTGNVTVEGWVNIQPSEQDNAHILIHFALNRLQYMPHKTLWLELVSAIDSMGRDAWVHIEDWDEYNDAKGAFDYPLDSHGGKTQTRNFPVVKSTGSNVAAVAARLGPIAVSQLTQILLIDGLRSQDVMNRARMDTAVNGFYDRLRRRLWGLKNKLDLFKDLYGMEISEDVREIVGRMYECKI